MFYYIVLSIQCIRMFHCSVLNHNFVVIKLLAKTLLINHKFWELKAIELKLSTNCFLSNGTNSRGKTLKYIEFCIICILKSHPKKHLFCHVVDSCRCLCTCCRPTQASCPPSVHGLPWLPRSWRGWKNCRNSR